MINIVWHMYSVCPRIISLYLFLYYGELYWFWVLVASHVVVMMGVYCIFYGDDEKHECSDICYFIILGLLTNSGYLYKLFSFGNRVINFRSYPIYWLVMFTENTVLMFLWLLWSRDLGLWSHDIVVIFIIIMYVLSILVDCLHAYYCNPPKEVT